MSSHRQIFKSTALIGGTQVINMVVGMLRTKVLAVLLGPAGLGLAGLYTTAASLISSFTGFGINASGVRQIAAAASSNDELIVARTIITLRRVALVSGLFGTVLVIALAPILSRTTFGDDRHVWGIGLMSLTLLFGSLASGQNALLQGLRRLRQLAIAQILGAVFGAAASIALVWWLRERGVVPFLIAIAAFSMLLSWRFARRVSVAEVALTWRESLTESRGLLGLGLAFTVATLIGSINAYLIRVMVQRQLGLEAVGIYTATWTLSSYYVGFILTAMATDFMPRLAAVARDNVSLNRLVNEQTEMGVLIALPGVLATLTLAPWVMHFFYSNAFVAGAEVVRWQILGIFLRVVSWPLGYVLVARGESLLFAATEFISGITGLGLAIACMKVWRLNGLGIYFVPLYVFYTTIMAVLMWRLTGFRWSARALKILMPATLFLAATFLGTRYLRESWSVGFGLILTVAASAASLSILQRLLNMNLLEKMRKKWAS